ncbi:hypothetical protein BVG16_19710 [Paenibacillus selenitireducens]|uniref:histidine kinase n=1 Tax=Paenibacillus selenitireducens TaxID=1324314 RepID=A0A1T2X7F4_9BACL|nr:hypothetical protein BVG16_19710 [Paenibacillus selenitireducens]
MSTPLKETFLQELIALLPAFLLQVWAMKPKITGQIFTFRVIFAIFCTISFLLSMVFSYCTPNEQYYDFRMIPFLFGLLYCGYRAGAVMTLIYIGAHFIFFNHGELWDFPNDIGLYLIPLALIFIPQFRHAKTPRRTRIITYLILFGGAVNFWVYFSHYGFDFEKNDIPWLMFEIGFSCVCILTTYLILMFVESILDKLSLQRQLQDLSQQFHQEAQKMKQLIDATPLGVMSVDKMGNLTAINDMMLRLFPSTEKVRSDDLIGKSFGYVMKHYDIHYPSIQLARSLQGEETTAEVLQYNGKILISTSSSIRNQETDEVVGAVGMAHDVTELQMLRSEIGNLERLSLVGQMAASITHEIRNPMAVVRGFVQLMKEKSDAALHDYYRIVLEELDRANTIINDFLSLAQNRIVEKEESHLHDIVRDLSPLLWADANLRGLGIEMNLGDDIPPLHLNEKEIKQLILNLVRNGMEAMNNKGTLTIETLLQKDTVQLIVKDTGEGIPQDKLDKMFEPFYTTKSKGTGLGLSLCLSIVERHKGRITVESEKGKGTTFIVSFQAHVA